MLTDSASGLLVANTTVMLAVAFEPSAIEKVAAIDHDRFTVREPAGHVLTFYSSHVSGEPV